MTLLLTLAGGCSLESEGLRSIRGHSQDFMGIAHAVPMLKAERYCKLCHGQNLVGGDEGEASCYTCHGQRWRDTDPDVSAAPADHTVTNGGFSHHPNQFEPLTTCTSCHGLNLEGNGIDDTPSCYLCHEQKW